VAPIGEGPVWVLRNEVVDYVEGCMKYWDGLDIDRGWIFVYHNTFVTRLAGSSPDMWAAIALDNGPAIEAALRMTEREMASLRAAINRADQEELRARFAAGRTWFEE